MGVVVAPSRVSKLALILLCNESIIASISTGETVPTSRHSKKYIRVFPMDRHTPMTPRNNELYDAIVNAIPDEDESVYIKKADEFKGHRGKCALRELKYFDVGMSFLSDSLHNCYHGAAVGYGTVLLSIVCSF